MGNTSNKIGGGALLVAGGILARETFAWAWTGLLNLLTAGAAATVSWSTFPWANAVGVLLMIAGICVLAWSPIRRRFRHARAPSEFDRNALADVQAQVVELEAKVSVIEKALERAVETLSKEPKAQELEISIRPLVDAIEALPKLKGARQLLASIPQPPDDPKSLSGPQAHFEKKSNIDVFLSSARTFLDLKIDSAEGEIQRITQDAQYLVLLDGEEERFGTAENKRKWHILAARCRIIGDSVRRYVEDIERRAAPLTYGETKHG